MLKPACVQHSTSVNEDFFQLDCKTARTFLATLSITLADIGYSVTLLIFHTISHMCPILQDKQTSITAEDKQNS